MECVLSHVRSNTVLGQLASLTYPTTFSLDTFITDLADRAAFLARSDRGLGLLWSVICKLNSHSLYLTDFSVECRVCSV